MGGGDSAYLLVKILFYIMLLYNINTKLFNFIETGLCTSPNTSISKNKLCHSEYVIMRSRD